MFNILKKLNIVYIKFYSIQCIWVSSISEDSNETWKMRLALYILPHFYSTHQSHLCVWSEEGINEFVNIIENIDVV